MITLMRIAIYGTYLVLYAALCVALDRALGPQAWFWVAAPVLFTLILATVWWGDQLRATAARHPRLTAILLP